MLALFAVTSGLMVPVGGELLGTDAEKNDYRVESQIEGCDTADDGRVTEFGELSPEAQDVFLSALESDDRYTTTVRPDDYQFSSDTTQWNYVVYESECYGLVASNRGGLGAGLLFWTLIVIGMSLLMGDVFHVPVPPSLFT
jgi:hypothetical protein